MKKILSLLCLFTLLAGCSNAEVDTSDKLTVVASFYPYAYFAEQLGGDLLDVKTLVPQGLEPHDYDPSPDDLKSLYNADLFVYNGAAFEPWIDDIATELTEDGVALYEAADFVELIPLAEGGEHSEEEAWWFLPRASAHDTGEEHIEYDPHFWLDPVRAQTIVQTLANTLGSLDPENTLTYQNNAKVIINELARIDASFASDLQTCTQKEFVASHAAFAYVADRYGLTMVPILGISPQDEPSIKELEAISSLVKEKGLTVIYTEPLLSSSFAEAVSRETGASLLTLNPLEGLTDEEVLASENYLTVMTKNLENLKAGFACEATPL